ncbi:centrosomal protein of 120 kDa-like [Saccoglossus kowalevskii]|uniref:Centrosomal protein of 120 kDa-like n=1 Tax=Saccoglossus kowalevskii TaxID=10224 RepID=A0ABM0LWY3_SACKO|nr:PREDICTED: centrosomal protein of 120 kDa-like [Saccoglossus kowalevskii]
MVGKEQYLVVVSILDGRRFPKRGKNKLIVETKFDGELLSTDPVDHIETPEFSTELAWELSKKALHQHRLQRTPIKLQCYAVDTLTNARENVGYVMLDLRTAAFQEDILAKAPVQSRWYPLLNTKYARLKPEVRISITLENDNQQEESFKARGAPPRKAQGQPDSDEELDVKMLQPVLNDLEGYYQIGPEHKCSDMFVMSVTIGFAANLTQLVPSSMSLPARDSGFFFYYNMFGNDVTNEVFHDLLNPTFPAERASVRLRSSPAALQLYFVSQPSLQAYLCVGDQSLGNATIPLAGLMKKDNIPLLDTQPVAIEGAFRLIPPQRTQQQLPPVPIDLAPVVGVSVSLRREEISLKAPVIMPTPQTPEKQSMDQKAEKITTPQKSQQEQPTKLNHSPPEKLERPHQATSPPNSLGSYTPIDDSKTTSDELSSLTLEDKDVKRRKDGERPKANIGVGLEPESNSTSSHPVLAVDAAAHHYSFSIDLRSIKDVDTPTAVNIFLRYTYPFFGSSAPIMTHPPVEVRRNTEVLLPHSFCAFDFATASQQLKETFLRIPLLVEVWHRDKMTQDALLGIARFSMVHILNAEKARVASKFEGSPQGWRQIYSERVPVESTDGKQRKIAELHLVVGLEDYGPINTREVLLSTEPSQSSTTEIKPKEPKRDDVEKAKDARETLEYKTAMELEMWKEAQEELYEQQLKDKEVLHMKALAEEWKRRDKERELLVRKKVDEYGRLEDQLRLAITDVERRERQLAANESEVMRLKSDLQRDYERKLAEIKDASHRMKEDCIHQVEMERSKVRDLEEQKQRLQEQLTMSERKIEEKEKDFQVYRGQINTKPEVRLQSEINLLTLEKVELERKLDAITKSKLHYKQQWGRALKELARLKQKEQAEARTRLKRQQQELEHMRLRYLAAEEKEVVKSEKKELEEIKGELSKFQQELQQQKQQAEAKPAEEHILKVVQHDDLDSSLDEHIGRLVEERDTLLRTGVYSHQDRIITELDKQIREAIASKS